MTLQEKILKCDEKEVEYLISRTLDKINSSCERKVLGVNDSLKFQPTKPHKGFIGENIKIRPHAFIEPYEVKTRDYFYEFAKYIRSNNIDNEYHLYCCILHFSREYLLSQDVENGMANSFIKYYEIKEFGDFKKNNKAACLEFSIIAQNLLALFGFETYICFGYLEHDTSVLPTPHAYNIIKIDNNYCLVDYMNPVLVYEGDKVVNYWLFEGNINENELNDFLNGNITKEFQEYMVIKEKMTYKYEDSDCKRKYTCYKKPKFGKDELQFKEKENKLIKTINKK